jgi:hypothetical protein
MLVVTTALACPASTPDVVPPPKPPTQPEPEAEPVLHEPVDSYDLATNPDLLPRLRKSPYSYFRFTNLRFAKFVCERFADAKESMPLVNLHGDAHLEQYAVTSLGRGLADYDDASTGPAVLDLVRFGVSLRLAARERGWDASPSLDAFLAGYRQALENPEADQPVPSCATRIQATFSDDRLEFLKQIEGLMTPLAPDDASTFEVHYARYVELMGKLHPDLPKHFFTIKKYGRLHSGVGSALAKKYLMRVEGDTDAPNDDVVLEAKELRDLSGISCITASVGGGAFRILLGQTRVGGQPMRFLAQIPRGPGEALSDVPIWVQAWLDNYHELSVADPGLTEAELREVSRDVGAQLGRGHVMKIADPMGAQLRAAQLQMLRELEPRIRASVTDMEALTLRSWKAFAADTSTAPPTQPDAHNER